MQHLELDVFPWIRNRPLAAMLPTELVRCLPHQRERGHLQPATRVREAVFNVSQ